MLNISLQLCDVLLLLLSPFTVFTLPSCPALCCSTAVHSRGAVRLIKARVQQEIRWAFVMSCVPHTNSRARGWGSSVHPPHSDRTVTAENTKMLRRKRAEIPSFIESSDLLHCTDFMLYTFYLSVHFQNLLLLISVLVMHAVLLLVGHQLHVVSLLLWFYDFISVKESLWVLLLYATIITGVVVETFPFVWTPPVSSRCHFAFHPHPLVRISAALLWVFVGEYCSLWVMVCNVICTCSNTSAHCVVLSSTAA